MYPCLGGISIQSDTVWVTWEPVHDGPAGTAGLVDLEAEIIVCASDGVVMLMDGKVSTSGVAYTARVVRGIRLNREQRGRGDDDVLGEVSCEMGEVVVYSGWSRLDVGRGRRRWGGER